ncbi:hypothetical protein, conserved [Eimeria necatrix]|uniref:Uncharacterized protein n=1 Tax=Eimeria necatrix TaxID=51315 RepID=U6N0X3_9EIME|nr:hypothetical protein, conserved [Eimeria necatrix]CDJ68419.1 hypothetical protein, conserved [Eimeria necatrix]
MRQMCRFVVEGTGRIVATGQLVQGFNTQFRQQIAAGDLLLLQHPLTLLQEEVLVESVGSDRTLYIQPSFSKDFISTTEFKIKKTAAAAAAAAAAAGGAQQAADPAAAAAAAAAAQQQQLQRRIEKAKRVAAVREKKGMWGYTVKQIKAKGPLTAEEKLDLRCKQGRDKFCW